MLNTFAGSLRACLEMPRWNGSESDVIGPAERVSRKIAYLAVFLTGREIPELAVTACSRLVTPIKSFLMSRF